MAEHEIPLEDRPVGAAAPGEPRPLPDPPISEETEAMLCTCGALQLLRDEVASWRREAMAHSGAPDSRTSAPALALYFETHAEYLASLVTRIEAKQQMLTRAAVLGALVDGGPSGAKA